MARLASTPLLLAVVLAAGADGGWLAVAVWFVLSCTDGVDGWLARRHGTTASGAFLDPLADKVVVIGAMAVLVANGVFWWLPVLLITVREVGISAYRAGIDSHFQTKVGDNLARMVLAIRTALARSDAVIVCGGIGPTQDDITREAIAEVMNVGLVRDPAVVEHIRDMFGGRGREMAVSNERQADRPEGADFIMNPLGTAPGLICPVGHKVVYAV